jgi:tyrosyl-tRNA synthetase
MPENMPKYSLTLPAAFPNGFPIAQLAKAVDVVESTSEALRLIQQRGLKVDGEVVSDKTLVIARGSTVVIQAGKRKFARVTIA